MPTKHPRHSITETPRMREALEPLRRRGERVELSNLVILGAQARLRQLEDQDSEEQRQAELRQRLVERLRTGKGFDIDALYEVRDKGWTH